MGLKDRSFTGNEAKILASQMKWEVLGQMFYGKWAKFNAPKAKVVVRPGNIPKPVQAPIVMQHELERQAGDHMKIPMLRNLQNLPTIGKDQMLGHEEEQQINHATVPIDILRHAVQPQEGIMQTQVTKDYQLIINAKPQLLRHYAEVEEFLGCGYALYFGHSYNILNSIRYSGDSYIKAISHPHIYCAGQGKVSYGVSDYPSTAGYESAIGTALGSMVETNVFDTNFLNGLRAHADIQNIDPLISKDNNTYWLLVVHPYQIHTLMQDEKFQAVTAQANAIQMAKENPYLVGCRYFWNGFAIFESPSAVWPVSVSDGAPVWGPSSIANMRSFRDYSSYNLFAAVLLGNNALFKGIGRGLEFRKEETDYGEVLGIAYRGVEGYSRADFWNADDGTYGQYVKNYGSAILVTWAEVPAM